MYENHLSRWFCFLFIMPSFTDGKVSIEQPDWLKDHLKGSFSGLNYDYPGNSLLVNSHSHFGSSFEIPPSSFNFGTSNGKPESPIMNALSNSYKSQPSYSNSVPGVEDNTFNYTWIIGPFMLIIFLVILCGLYNYFFRRPRQEAKIFSTESSNDGYSVNPVLTSTNYPLATVIHGNPVPVLSQNSLGNWSSYSFPSQQQPSNPFQSEQQPSNPSQAQSDGLPSYQDCMCKK